MSSFPPSLILGALVLLAGCFDPDLSTKAGGYRCGGPGDCPANMTCNSAGVCETGAPPGDAAVSPDQSGKCGNNIIDKDEVCEKGQIGSASCKDKGLDTGTPICVQCKSISYSPCYTFTRAAKNTPTLDSLSSAKPVGVWHQDGNGAAILWHDPLDKTDRTAELRKQFLDSALGTKFDNYGINLTKTAKVSERDPAVTRLGTLALAVWSDNKSGTDDIYAARLDKTGSLMKQGGTLVFDHKTADLRYPSVACHKTGTGCLVVWYEHDSKHPQVRGEMLSYFGGTLKAQGTKGIFISANLLQKNLWPAVASDGSDYLVVWAQESNNIRTIVGRRVSALGVVATSTTKSIGGKTNSAASNPSVGYLAGTDRFVVAWTDSRDGNEDIYAARVDKKGTPHGADKEGVPLATGSSQQQYPKVACNKDTCLVAFVSGKPDLVEGVRLEEDGAALVVVDSPAIQIGTADRYKVGAPWPFTDKDGNFMVVWRDNYVASAYLKSALLKP